jgi:hypothetical protein
MLMSWAIIDPPPDPLPREFSIEQLEPFGGLGNHYAIAFSMIQWLNSLMD